MNWIELWAKIQVISSIIGYVIAGIIMLIWIIALIVEIFRD